MPDHLGLKGKVSSVDEFGRARYTNALRTVRLRHRHGRAGGGRRIRFHPSIVSVIYQAAASKTLVFDPVGDAYNYMRYGPI